MHWASLSEDPGIARSALAIPYGGDGSGSFMQGDRIAKLVSRSRLAAQWPHGSVALMDSDTCVARGVCVPFASTTEGREPFPDGGWDQAVIWAAEDALDARPTDTLCALEIAVAPSRQRQGLSRLVLEAMRANSAKLGYSRMIAPVRPPGKVEEPNTPMGEYASRVRPDGLPTDPWLRVHVRAGGRIVKVASTSAVVIADLDTWRRWTGVPLIADGQHLVPGGLAPVTVVTETNLGIYVEPNVWVDHTD